MSETLTILVPANNEQDCIDTFVTEVESVAKANDSFPKYDIVFVDDGSTDKTLSLLKEQSSKKSNVKYLSFSRNFGKEAAIFAGLKETIERIDSDYYVLMDADLQDPPSLLPKMLSAIKEDGIDRVGTRRVDRKGEPPIRSFFARRFYRMMNRMSQIELVDGARDYQLMTKQYAKALIQCNEYNRFFKGLSQWVGFNTKWIEYENIKREKGQSKWSFWQLLSYSIEGAVAYSTWPLRIISVFGLILSLISIVALLVVFFRALIIGDPVAGWPSLVCIILIISGLVFTCLGILGLYFEKTYLEVKNRPIYILKEDNLQNVTDKLQTKEDNS